MSLSKRRQSSGFSLLEMMITLVVLSVGLLGIAALQTRGQQFTHAAYIRTQAAILGYDIMERIRINANFAVNDLPPAGTTPSDGDGYVASRKAGTAPNPDCDTASCTPAQLCDYDLWQWYTQVEEKLPMPIEESGGQVRLSSITAEDRASTSCPRAHYTLHLRWYQKDNETLDASNNVVERDKTIDMELCL